MIGWFWVVLCCDRLFNIPLVAIIILCVKNANVSLVITRVCARGTKRHLFRAAHD